MNLLLTLNFTTMQKLFIIRQSYPMNPREDADMLGTIAYIHSRYELGEEKISDPIEWLEEKLGLQSKGIYTNERLAELEERFFSEFIALPLYLYDHSGITMKTTPFSCSWDSGKVGYIYVSKEKIRKEYSWKVITKTRREKIEEYLRNEVKEFDYYLTGEVFRYKIEDENGEEVDSCSGFYGQDWQNNGIKDHIDKELWPQLENIEVAYTEEH